MTRPGTDAVAVDRHRLFFAVWPDPVTAATLADEAQRLAPRLEGRAMRAETLHLTLAFLGNRSGAQRDRLCEGFDHANRSGWPGGFALRLDRLQQWRHNGIVLAASSERCEPLHRLAGLVSELSRTCGIHVPERPFVPHLTLLRRCRGELPARTGGDGPWHWAVRAFRLVESFLGPDGASYRVIGEWALPSAPRADGGG